MKPLNIVIGADIVPTASNIDLFSKGDIVSLFGDELLNVLENADYRIFNLEVPLCDIPKPIKKNGPNLIAPTSTICAIKAINPSLLSLANNHILDQDKQGLYSTIGLLDDNDIPYLGAGNNLSEAFKPYILEKDGLKIGVYACSEHEFTIATEESAGANPFDPLESLDHIANLKNECDYVIVLYHGGKEHYRYPSPNLQKICRKIAQKGADLVVCQHSHCIGCFEEYGGSTIVYGQGNFLFDHSVSEFWQTSLLINITFDSSDIIIDYIPLIKCANTVRVADEKQKSEILDAFNERSKQILQPAFIENEYNKFAQTMIDNYLNTFLGGSLIFKVCNKLLKNKLWRLLYSKKALLKIHNYVECEPHRELMLSALKIEEN